MGKVDFVYDKKSRKLIKSHSVIDAGMKMVKEYRQFMVRKLRHLEIIYTDGLEYWTVQVDQSEVKPPYYIADILMSNDNGILLSYSSIRGNEAAF